MNIPCANSSHFCPCTDNPLANLTSEAPDVERLIKINYYPIIGPTPVVLCETATADMLVNLNCPCDPAIQTCPCPPPTCNPPCDCPPCCRPPDDNPIIEYYSIQCTCNQCGLFYTLPAGSKISTVSQEDANQRAQSECQSIVNQMAAISRACQNPPPPVNPCSIVPVVSGYGQVSPVEAGVGEDLTLSVFYYYLGSLPLTFTWYKDGIAFETGSVVGPIVSLTLENLTLGDAGIYYLGIKPQGCSEVFSNNIEVQMVLCNCGILGQVPLNLLEADGTVMVDFTGSVVGGVPANDTTFNITAGRFALQYMGGFALECEHNGHLVTDCATSAFRSICSIDCDVWVDYDSDTILETNLATVSFGDDVTEIGNVPANTCQNGYALAANQEALFPLTYPGGQVAALLDLLPVVGQPTFQSRIRCAPAVFFLWPLGAICGGQYPTDAGDCTDGIPICPGTNTTRFQVVRTHKFLDMPYPVTIKDFANVWSMIVPPGGSTDPDYTAQWAGVFNEEPSVASLITLNYRINSVAWGVGGFGVNASLINCALGPAGFWQLTIWATWHDPGGHSEILWRGRKYKGENVLGSYCYVSSYNPVGDVPSCVILE